MADGLRYYVAGTYPSLTQAVVHCQTVRVAALRRGAEVVQIGDSSATYGFVPERFEELTGWPAENMGLIQPLGLAGYTDLLETYLGLQPPPRVVILTFTEGTLSQSAKSLEAAGMLPAFRVWLGRDDGATSLWPSTRLRGPARRLLGGAWYEPYPNLDSTCAFLERHHGFMLGERDRPDWRVVPETSTVDPSAWLELERLAAVTAERGIRLVLIHGAIPALYDTAGRRSALARLEEQLEAFAAGQPHAHVVKPFARFLPNESFIDYHHLTLAGALADTGYIAGVIRRIEPARPGP